MPRPEGGKGGGGKAEVRTVRIAGKIRHLCIDNNAFCIVEEMTGANMLEGVNNPSMSIMRALCYAALRSGARQMGARVDFTVEDVGDWIADAPEMLEAVTDLAISAAPPTEGDGKEATPPQGETTLRAESA